MSQTKTFREQHDELLKIATEIASHLDVDALAKDASKVRSLLSRLLGVLSIHLSMEDKSLYPRLLAHDDVAIKSMAQRFMDEMGGIGKVLEEYKTKWMTVAKIQDNSAAFVTETKGIIDALALRIEKENNELYEALDKLG